LEQLFSANHVHHAAAKPRRSDSGNEHDFNVADKHHTFQTGILNEFICDKLDNQFYFAKNRWRTKHDYERDVWHIKILPLEKMTIHLDRRG